MARATVSCAVQALKWHTRTVDDVPGGTAVIIRHVGFADIQENKRVSVMAGETVLDIRDLPLYVSGASHIKKLLEVFGQNPTGS